MNAPAIFDAALLRRYDRPGPRYTSYPTAPHFSPRFDVGNYRACARQSNEELISRELSLYVHVPFCLSPCFYCGCTRVITRDRARGVAYVARLEREIAIVAPLFDRDRNAIQLHFGGGTPNFLDAGELARLLHCLDGHFSLSDREDRDFSIELDPRTLERGDVMRLAALGLRRVSLGVQDFDPAVQSAVNRIQSVEQTLAVIDECRASGMRSVNVDLIYGLPKQTCEGFARTLDTIIAARPDRLAIYGYAHLPEMFKPQRQIDSYDLPDAVARMELFQLAAQELTENGYRFIGMDHFALPSDDLSIAQAAGNLQRNFMGYTIHGDSDLIGLGVSAISHVADSYSQNHRDLPGWERALDANQLPICRGLELDADDVLRADVIQQLMCTGAIDIAQIERDYEIDFRHYFADALAQLDPLGTDGLVTVEAGQIAATARGRFLLRVIAMCFDAYISGAQGQRYSRVI
ncbi:MAG TPA: oxygen-independent coproporphyrinogen III oxidase [Steroidobacteraceae bacterium]